MGATRRTVLCSVLIHEDSNLKNDIQKEIVYRSVANPLSGFGQRAGYNPNKNRTKNPWPVRGAG